MKNKTIPASGILNALLTIICLLGFQMNSNSQVTTYQYRHVPENKIEEFIKRETTYWSKVVQKAVDEKKMLFRGLFEKVGGYDLPNSSNYLFINRFSNIDSSGSIWGDAEAIGGVSIDKMETNSFSTTTSQFLLHDEDWAQAGWLKPGNEFNYVVMYYHNSNNADSFINLEKKYWKPFIKTAMDKKLTSQMGWGNARILSSLGDNIKCNTVSYDLFPTLQDALLTPWDPKAVFPLKGLGLLEKTRINRSGKAIYRIVKVVSAN